MARIHLAYAVTSTDGDVIRTAHGSTVVGGVDGGGIVSGTVAEATGVCVVGGTTTVVTAELTGGASLVGGAVSGATTATMLVVPDEAVDPGAELDVEIDEPTLSTASPELPAQAPATIEANATSATAAVQDRARNRLIDSSSTRHPASSLMPPNVRRTRHPASRK